MSVIIVAKEDQNGGAAVNAVSKKRPVEDSVALAGPSPKVKKETKAPKTESAPNTKAAPKKTGAVRRGAKKVW